MNEKIQELLEDNRYLKEEANAAIKFVSDLLEICIDDMTENEPYATDTIREIMMASIRVSGLEDVIEENIS